MTADHCIHVANLFYLGSYLCKDILWLRVLTCAGLIFGIIFFCCQADAMFAPASWMSLFLVVNVVQIVRTLRDRYDTRLSPSQQEIGDVLLKRLTREDMLNVLTKSMCQSNRRSQLLEQIHAIRLSREERIVRDTAFDRLSDQELVNLIVRRFWPSIRRRRTGWFGARRKRSQPARA
ncbi:hypothetical protein [Novipirellula caenicola]|uniref:Uncharacterized protein n=1 Tax=Novipirellula caenicola TaxID=1536901 RepID=A0ABP9W0Q3_9BACT